MSAGKRSAEGDSTHVAARSTRGPTRLGSFAYGVGLVGLAIGAITGFGVKLVGGEFEGWPLYIHMLGAPIFIIGLALTAFVWADRCSFGAAGATEDSGLTASRKLLFWIEVGLGFAVAVSMLAAMVPVFGYAGQEVLHEIHEISALLLVIAVVVHAVGWLAVWRVKR